MGFAAFKLYFLRIYECLYICLSVYIIYSSLTADEWLAESRQLHQVLDRSLQHLASTTKADVLRRVQLLRRTQIEQEVQQAMGK